MQLIQATLMGPNDRSDRLIYLVQVDGARVQQVFGERDEQSAVASAISTVQSAITGAFPSNILVWDAPMVFDMAVPAYDPLYEMDGVRAWILPVVSKNEAYLYLVG
jgi:hypothetical protein